MRRRYLWRSRDCSCFASMLWSWVGDMVGGDPHGGRIQVWVVSGGGSSSLVVMLRSFRCGFWSHRKGVPLGCLPTPLTPISCIVLQGQWIERDHCTITSACGVVILRPARGARCTVNGREVTASCRLTQGKTAYSSIYARMRDGLSPFSWDKPRELSEAGFKVGTPSLCTQRCEDFLIPPSSHKQRSLNSRVPGWRMTLWNLYLCPWEGLWTSVFSSVKKP